MNDNRLFIPDTYRETRDGIQPVSIPSELFKDRKLFLIGEVNSTSMGVLMMSLMCLEKISKAPIDLYINSPGGEIKSGLAVYRYITEQMQSKVHTYCIGTAASMAAILFMCGHERFIYPGAEIMVHDPASISGTFEKPDALKERLASLEKSKKMLCEIIAERTGHTFDEIAEITKKDTYFDADEAVAFGLATKILRKETV